MRILFIVFCFILTMFSAYSSPKSLMNSWEVQRYKLQDQSILDLSFDIRIKGQSEELTAQKKFGKVKDLYYTMYWRPSGNIDIKVNGLDGKWRELKQSLKSNLFGIIEVLFPSSLFKVTRGYEVSMASPSVIKAEDKSFQKAFQEMLLKFNKVGVLTEIKSKNSLGTQILTFVNEKSRQTKNNYFTKKIIKKNFYGPRTINSIINISYGKEGKYFLPKGVELTTELSVPPGGDKKSDERVIKKSSEVVFSNFSVNKNVAMKYFKK